MDGYTEYTNRCFLEKQLKPRALYAPKDESHKIMDKIVFAGTAPMAYINL